MADYDQIPGELNLTFVEGDDLVVVLDFDVDLTGYTFVAKIGNDSMIVTEVDLSQGQITLSFDETGTLTVGTPTDWYLAWTSLGLTRTVLAGTVTIKAHGDV